MKDLITRVGSTLILGCEDHTVRLAPKARGGLGNLQTTMFGQPVHHEIIGEKLGLHPL